MLLCIAPVVVAITQLFASKMTTINSDQAMRVWVVFLQSSIYTKLLLASRYVKTFGRDRPINFDVVNFFSSTGQSYYNVLMYNILSSLLIIQGSGRDAVHS